MNYYTLNDLNIKLLDFIILLSPLGDVKKFVSNGNQHLVEIFFHKELILKIDNDNITNNKINLESNGNLNDSLLKIYNDMKLGFIINNKCAIIEIPKGINADSAYLEKVKDKDKQTISKYIRKNIPKDCQKILKSNIVCKNKITDPDKINILNFPGYQQVQV
tara:strand:- start:823 stop:1308 length:486 start_codon:yes stop_codon:yes gene_type:complete